MHTHAHRPRVLPLLIAAGMIYASSLAVQAQSLTAPGIPAGNGRVVPEDVSLPVDAMFRDMRAAYYRDATADKIAVTVRERDRMPQMAVLVLRIGSVIVRETVKPPAQPAGAAAPADGAAPASPAEPAPDVVTERRARVISIDAGDLRLHVQDRKLTIVLASNPTAYFAADLEDGPITPQLTKVVGPLPLLPLMLAEWRDGETFPAIAPQVSGQQSSWFKATTRLEPAGSPITLLGTTPFGAMSMQVDGRTFRPTQALAAVSPSPRSTLMELELSPREPGDPGKWGVLLDGRTRVGAISQLARRIEPVKVPAPPSDAPGAAKPDAPMINPPTTSAR